MRLASLGLMMMFVTGILAAQPERKVEPEIVDLSGYYTCNGVEAGGKKKAGVCVVTKAKDVYVISWLMSGGSTFSGIAIRQGDALAASWSITTERGTIRGVNLYR